MKYFFSNSLIEQLQNAASNYYNVGLKVLCVFKDLINERGKRLLKDVEIVRKEIPFFTCPRVIEKTS
jgi:hypothetical protein